MSCDSPKNWPLGILCLNYFSKLGSGILGARVQVLVQAGEPTLALVLLARAFTEKGLQLWLCITQFSPFQEPRESFFFSLQLAFSHYFELSWVHTKFEKVQLPYSTCPHMCSLLHYQHPPPEWWYICTIGCTLTHHPKSVVYIRNDSWCCDFYNGLGIYIMTCMHH